MKISMDNDARVDESSRGMRLVYVLCILKIIDYMLWIRLCKDLKVFLVFVGYFKFCS